ncbi:hypothetical protein [Streptomyces sp. NPDC002790]|uniref:hypothetical protein n=1 Tax=Streptomyces sp. NPDC002790 TaxID=3154431 RepID=UPI00331D761E
MIDQGSQEGDVLWVRGQASLLRQLSHDRLLQGFADLKRSAGADWALLMRIYEFGQ